MTPRIAPGQRREVGTFAWAFARIAGRVAGTNPPNLFLTMARQRKLFRGWLRFARRLMPGGSLPRRDTELIILRVAHLRGCAYEFEHHVRLGRRVGVSTSDVARIKAGSADPDWSSRERALLRAVDELITDRFLDDATWRDLRMQLSEPACVEFVLLVGHYDMLATFLLTLRVPSDHAR
ncbi:MAG TPA: carboxymuconolactone decarboxylase family protein [Jatrophihabitans sp.]|nr:carboxymuconolactone decarboxylase family protein [Jatrophihabitans sp.]